MLPQFGTDGIRGRANGELTPEVVLALGRAAARVLGPGRFVVGRDTRLSGPMLQAALSAGMAAEGCQVDDLGVLATPGVAWVAATDGVPAAVISASHNPYDDNGVKLFTTGGRKLDDDTERRIETEFHRLLATPPASSGFAGGDVTSGEPPTPPVGVVTQHSGRNLYVRSLLSRLDGRRLDGMHVVLDCANGAAFDVAPEVFADLGAHLDVINDLPDGRNINEGCGSTHPEMLQREVLERRAHVGLAFDGDADRVLAVDERGNLVDGDHLLGIFAVDLRARGALAGDTLVVTVMSNLGLRQAMAAEEIHLRETLVGDRYVLEELAAGGWSLGGEQSGHVIFSDLATTGDGILAGLLLVDAMARSGRTLSELAAVVVKQPQVLANVAVAEPGHLAEAAGFWADVAEVEAALGDEGRVVVRASGTEPLVRVMVEASQVDRAEAACDRLCASLRRALGATA